MRVMLVVLSCFISFHVFSQEFVIKKTGDTLFGEVKVKYNGDYKISVKPDGEKEFLKFEGKEIQAYQIGEEGMFEKKEKAVYGFFVKKEIVGNGAPYVIFLEPVDANSTNAISLYLELTTLTFVNDPTRGPSTIKIIQKEQTVKPKTYGLDTEGRLTTTSTTFNLLHAKRKWNSTHKSLRV